MGSDEGAGDKGADLDVDRAHRWFAVEYNNQAWELIETSPDYLHASELLSRAYASHRHWFEVGGRFRNNGPSTWWRRRCRFLGIPRWRSTTPTRA